MVKAPRRSDDKLSAPEKYLQDFWGLLLFFLGAAGLLCLCWKQPGLLPDRVDSALRLLAGTGAYALPLLALFAGTMFLIGYERLSLSRSSLGSLLLFLIFITGRHIALVPASFSWTGDEARGAGGMLGALFGAALLALLGPVISYLLLALLTALAVLLLVDQPFIVLLNRLRQGGAASASAINRLAATGKAIVAIPGTGGVGNREQRTGNSSIQNPKSKAQNGENGTDDRAERHARVVERALVGSGQKRLPARRRAALPRRRGSRARKPGTCST